MSKEIKRKRLNKYQKELKSYFLKENKGEKFFGKELNFIQENLIDGLKNDSPEIQRNVVNALKNPLIQNENNEAIEQHNTLMRAQNDAEAMELNNMDKWEDPLS